MNSLHQYAMESQHLLAQQAFEVLQKYKIVYFNSQERTGKTITALLTADKIESKKLLFIVKRANVIPWKRVLMQYRSSFKFDYQICTFGLVKKLDPRWVPDTVLIDESHNFVSAFPTPGKNYKFIREVCLKAEHLILLSATPHGNSYAQLYHQFWLSKHTPWPTKKLYRGTGFYEWFNKVGIPKTTYGHGGRIVPVYKDIRVHLIQDVLDKYFVGFTRKELGFKYEPEDVVHYIELDETTKRRIKALQKDRYIKIEDFEYEVMAHAKLLHGIYQIEGGTLKLHDKESRILDNTEKIQWILKEFGDVESLVIMYHYIHEEVKLRMHFTKAKILQGTRNAEGIDLSMYQHLVIYSQDWSTIKYSQRRCRQANINRKWPIKVHFPIVKGCMSEQVYKSLAIKKRDFIDSMFEPVLGGTEI